MFDYDDIHSARHMSLMFWQRIIEDLTYEEVYLITYHEDEEYLEVEFKDKSLPKLLISIRYDSITACTRDVIRQTEKWGPK